MRLPFLLFIVLLTFSQLTNAQNGDPFKKSNGELAPPSTEEEFERQYNKRIKKEKLHNVYIPKDLADAFVQLNKLVDSSSQQKFKGIEEQEAIQRLSGGFGRWIVHNWGFYGGSRYSHQLKKMGIHHPEEMATFTMIMYHRYLNKNKLEVKKYLEAHKAKKEKKLEEEKKNRKVLKTFKRKRAKKE